LGTPEETTRAYGYAPFGKLSQTEVLGVPNSKSRFFYDQEGRLILSTDPERGQKFHEYNGFGELTRRLEGANSGSDAAQPLETSYTYDLLGRLDTKTVKQNGVLRSITNNTYDSLDGRTTLGALLRAAFTDQVAGGYTHITNYYFDSLSRPAASEYTLRSNVKADPGETFRVAHSYDALGRPQSLTYPKLTGQSEATRVFYEYAPAATSNGRLLRVKALEQLQGDAAVAKETLLWEAEATDQQDRLSQFQVGNGVHTQHNFDWRSLTTATTVTTDGQDD
jgi:YD repeat-containing protein